MDWSRSILKFYIGKMGNNFSSPKKSASNGDIRNKKYFFPKNNNKPGGKGSTSNIGNDNTFSTADLNCNGCSDLTALTSQFYW